IELHVIIRSSAIIFTLLCVTTPDFRLERSQNANMIWRYTPNKIISQPWLSKDEEPIKSSTIPTERLSLFEAPEFITDQVLCLTPAHIVYIISHKIQLG